MNVGRNTNHPAVLPRDCIVSILNTRGIWLQLTKSRLIKDPFKITLSSQNYSSRVLFTVPKLQRNHPLNLTFLSFNPILTPSQTTTYLNISILLKDIYSLSVKKTSIQCPTIVQPLLAVPIVGVWLTQVSSGLQY